MRSLDRFLAPEPDDDYQPTVGYIRRHRPAPPSPVEAAAAPVRTRGPHAFRADMAWALDAACKGQPTGWWVPSNVDLRGINERGPTPDAERLCDACPVTAACLAHALEHHEEGYWGGTTERDRRRIRRRNRKLTPVVGAGDE